MRFYYTKSGVKGLLPDGRWMLFATEEEYISYIRENEEEEDN